MRAPEPILVADRFPALRERLLDLLSGLHEPEWQHPATPLWSVRDVATHLLGGDIGILSRRRDEFRPGPPIQSHAELVMLVNRLNDQWIQAARRMSGRVLYELLAFTGPLVEAYFSSLDPFAIGEPVSWAGPEAAPVWLDVAREYTERWHHQQQIRDATGREALYEGYFFAPVLDAFVRALPYGFRDVTANEGAVVELEIPGPGGGRWFLERGRSQWGLWLNTNEAPAAKVVLPADFAWRLFTKGISGATAREAAVIEGDAALAAPVFSSLAIIG